MRQAAQESGKRAELAVEGASGELDRQVLDKMLPPFEHMLRNAVVHGIEEAKLSARKRAARAATSVASRFVCIVKGAEMVIDVADDGRRPRRRIDSPQSLRTGPADSPTVK